MRSVLERLGLVSAPGGDNSYHAFISYSHAVDGALAPAIQRGLQRFAKPWYRARALRVFRDEASLSANPGLWSSIEEALDSSTFFVLLASPDAASSPWVAREAAHWRAVKRIQNLLIGVTDGELVWDEEARDFDWQQTTSLPETLSGAFGEEPRFIDLRWAHTGEQLSLDHPRFRDAIAELAAPLHGVPKDVLAGEEVRQQRRTLRIARTAGAALACLTIASTLFAAFFLVQRNEARRQRDLATSRALVQAAAANLDSRMDRAALLSLEAYRIRPSAEAKSSLIRALQRTEHIGGLLHVDQPVERIVLDADRDILVAAGSESVTVWRLGPPAEVDGVLPVPRAKALALRPDGAFLAVGGPTAISLWTLESTPRLSRRIRFAGAKALAFSHDGRRLSVVGPTNVAVFDTQTGDRVGGRALGMSVSTAEFAPGGSLVAIGGLDTLILVEPGTRRPPRRIRARETPLAVALDTEPERVAALGLQGDVVTVWNAATGRVSERIPVREAAQAVAFAPDGRLALGLTDGTVVLLSIGGTDPPQVLRGPVERIFDVEFPQEGLLATAGEQGIIVLWSPSRSTLRRELAVLDAPITAVDFSERGTTLAVGGFGDAVTVWSLERGSPRPRRVRTGPVIAVAVDRAGSRLAVADGGVVLHEGDGATRTLQPGSEGSVGALEVSADILAWSMPGRVVLWDAATARRLEPLPAVGTPRDLAFGADGDLLVVAEERGARLWDLSERGSTDLVRDKPVSAVAISRSGRVAASAAEGQVLVEDVERGSTRFALPISQGTSVELAFSPDERTLAVGTSERTLLLVDAQSGQPLGTPLPVPGGPVSGLDFSADGAILVTGTQGRVVTLWDDLLWSDVPAMRRRLCAVAGRNLSPDEWREHVPGQSYRTTCP